MPAAPATQFSVWQGHRCAYEVWSSDPATQATPLLLIHPIGVGLSRRFWDRWLRTWQAADLGTAPQPIYNPDLLGCGDSDMPHVAYRPEDWAAPLWHLIQTVIQRPVIVLVQGASFSIGIELAQMADPGWIRGLVLSGPPAWPLMTQSAPNWQKRLSWNLFDSPLGWGFYQYAKRREFIRSFSARQLFDQADAVDAEWLDQLTTDAQIQPSRHAVFSFLAGFWRKDYTQILSQLQPPTLVVLGKTASSISRAGQSETPEQRLADYLQHLPQAEGLQISGRNVLPYESAPEFVAAIRPFIAKHSTGDSSWS